MSTKKGYKSVPWLFGKEIEIPEEWEVKKIDDIFDFLISGTNARSDLNDSSEIRYIHYGDIHTEWKIQLDCDLEKIPRIDIEKVSRLPLLKEGDLIIADASEDVEGSGTSILLKNVKNKKIVAGLHTLVLRRKNENISFNFMKYLTSISHVKIQITSWVTGAKVFGLTKKSCKEIRIPLPTLPEQQKIATILSNVDSLIESTSKIIKNSKSLKTGLMQKLLTRGIGHTKFKKVPWLFGKEIEIPEEWGVIRLNKLLLNQNSGLHNKLEKSNEGDNIVGMYDLYQVNKIDGQIFTLAHFPNIIKNKVVEKQKYLFEENDFVYIEISLVKEGVGKTVLVTKNGKGTFFAGNLRRFKISDLDISPEFLYQYLNTNMIRNYMISTSYTSAQTGITTKDYFKTQIIIPPLPEQQKIASILSNMDFQIDSQTQYKDKLERLKKSLMQKLLTGEIRVRV